VGLGIAHILLLLMALICANTNIGEQRLVKKLGHVGCFQVVLAHICIGANHGGVVHISIIE